MGKALTSDVIKLIRVRGSFLRLYKPKAFEEGQEPRFEATFLLDPTAEAHKAQIAAVKAATSALVKAKWGEKPPGLKLCFGLADNDEKKARYDGYKGMWYIASANTTRPGVVDRNRQPVAEGQKQTPYSGCYVNTNITLWTQDNKFAKAIRCNLRIVQFNEDGQAFGGGAAPDADDEFEALGDAPGAKSSAPVDDSEF